MAKHTVYFACILAMMIALTITSQAQDKNITTNSKAGLSINEEKEALAAQNRYRAEVNVTPLKWSENLSARLKNALTTMQLTFFLWDNRNTVVHRGSGRTSPWQIPTAFDLDSDG